MKPEVKDWPDRGQVERIREALWRPTSRATVMVGAGMSRNARKLANGVAQFPLWSDISRALVQDLYPGEKPWPGLDAMQLGQEYTEVYGRNALDDRLKKLVPDEQYEPGELHKRLLTLPWADVFTTNYDRLLERTLPYIFGRTYDVVLTAQDLAEAERPRIVKLHGSFPAQRPFLFTSEDYRSYPERFAPFVNTVRQSVMESHLCLIGFSGDDPNFLQWIGWVRDQLGASMRHVYLCGVLDLSEPRRRYFQSLRITPIDLGILFPRNEWDGRRYEVALDWFLTSLHNARPVDDKDWPVRKSCHVALLTQDEQMPAPLSRPEEVAIPPWPPAILPKDEDAAYHERVLAVCKAWRQTDPGWAVCPEENRQALTMARLLDWCYGLHASEKRAAWLREQPVLQRARTLRELAWSLRRCLLPLSDWIATLIISTLEAFNPKPKRISLDFRLERSGEVKATERAATITPDSHRSQAWGELTEIWVELAFALVNGAWQMQDAEMHDRWMGRLEGVIQLNESWCARYAHAQAWHHLVRLDEEGVRSSLGAWPDLPEQPYWQAKRAAVLAEIGEYEQARIWARSALERVRRAMSRSHTDYAHRSQEGWILDLVIRLEGVIRHQNNEHRREGEVEDFERLEILDVDRCDPRTDIRKREQRLLVLPSAAVRTLRTPGFNIGHYKTVVKVHSDSAEVWVLLQNFCDGVRPLGFHSSSKSSDNTALADALGRLWPDSPRLAISTGLRAGESRAAEALHTLLDRAGVAELSQDTAGELYMWLAGVQRRAMDQWIAHGPRGSMLHQKLLDRCPELVSRLILRIADDHLDDAFELVQAMQAHAYYRESRNFQPLLHMWERLLMAASAARLQAWMPQILNLDIPDLGSSPWDSNFPEPSDYFSETVDAPSDKERVRWAQAINTLIVNIHSGSPFVRERSCRRLTSLMRGGALDDEQKRRLAEAIWSLVDDTKLPMHTDLLPHVFLALPELEAGSAENVVRTYFLRTARVEHFEQNGVESIHYLRSLIEATHVPWPSHSTRGQRIEWTASEQACLAEQLVTVWKRYQGNVRDEQLGRFGVLMHRALFRVLASGQGIRGEVTKDVVLKALQELRLEMSKSGVVMVEASLFDLLSLDTERDVRITRCAQEISKALYGLAFEMVSGATRAIFYWHAYAGPAGLFPDPPRDLLDELIGHAVSRRQPGLTSVLNQLSAIIRDLPTVIDQPRIESMQRALGYMHEDFVSYVSTQAQGGERSEPMARHERLEHHYMAAHFAAVLARLLQQRGQRIPEEVEVWRGVADNSPLPEVRRLWRTL